MPITRSAPKRDADNTPYWDGAARGELRLQRCAACGVARFYPRLLCPECWSDSVGWFTASGDGTVYSYSVVHRAPSANFADAVPYVVALIDLDEGPRMLSNVEADDPEAVQIGDRVRVRFERVDENSAIPVFVKVAA
ncbi:Zn-ribbon domain-containing OB-fold protein [Sporichthya sp.]|uniref:Zn-ribbon domain-containing OB-fold protein n=1 Tax=Sporichthya sp. TaxID=65475 RepID=UPI001854B726|nr:Zn-ribbon domain-containing OB-fold protein [Sporichthya sp.]MBA3741380.1 Zn-ribbon domain-containing OB-fold protein [Sporichthya sp.]